MWFRYCLDTGSCLMKNFFVKAPYFSLMFLIDMFLIRKKLVYLCQICHMTLNTTTDSLCVGFMMGTPDAAKENQKGSIATLTEFIN